MTVGDTGNGTLNLTNNAAIKSDAEATVGDNIGAAVGQHLHLSSGSSLAADANGLTIGLAIRAPGTVSVDSGAQLTSNGDLTLGEQTGGQGTLQLSGAGTQVDYEGKLEVGAFGSGELDILAGSKVSYSNTGTGDVAVGSDFFAGTTSTSLIKIDGNGSKLNADTLGIGGEIDTVGSPGSVELTNQAQLQVADKMRIWSHGTLGISSSNT